LQKGHPQDIRDRAILLLLAVYGLRSGEVVALTLDDVNWEQNILHVSRPKQRVLSASLYELPGSFLILSCCRRKSARRTVDEKQNAIRSTYC
jgi:integrase